MSTSPLSHTVARSISLGIPIMRRKSLCEDLQKIGNQAISKLNAKLKVRDRRKEIEVMEQGHRQQLERDLIMRQERSQRSFQSKKTSNLKKLIQRNSIRASKSEVVKKQRKSFIDRSFLSSQKKRKEMEEYFLTRQQSKRSTSSAFRVNISERRHSSFDQTLCPHLLKQVESPKPHLFSHSQSVDITNLNQYITKRQSQYSCKEQKNIDQVVKKIIFIQKLKNQKLHSLNQKKQVKPYKKANKIYIAMNDKESFRPSDSDTRVASNQASFRVYPQQQYQSKQFMKRMSAGDILLRKQNEISSKNVYNKQLKDSRNELLRKIHFTMNDNVY